MTNLTFVYFSLNCVVHNETVDEAGPDLPVSEHSADSLTVMTRIPRSIKNDDAVGCRQVDTETTGTSGQ